jgi:hypothetical protein
MLQDVPRSQPNAADTADVPCAGGRIHWDNGLLLQSVKEIFWNDEHERS